MNRRVEWTQQAGDCLHYEPGNFQGVPSAAPLNLCPPQKPPPGDESSDGRSKDLKRGGDQGQRSQPASKSAKIEEPAPGWGITSFGIALGLLG